MASKNNFCTNKMIIEKLLSIRPDGRPSGSKDGILPIYPFALSKIACDFSLAHE